MVDLIAALVDVRLTALWKQALVYHLDTGRPGCASTHRHVSTTEQSRAILRPTACQHASADGCSGAWQTGAQHRALALTKAQAQGSCGKMKNNHGSHHGAAVQRSAASFSQYG
jgi:hypothetical protein